MVIRHLKQIGKVKKLLKWLPHELTEKKKKNHRLEVSSSLILCNSNVAFLNWIVTCDQKWILYNKMSWRRSSKALPKAKLAPKKVMVTVWWSAASLIHYSFLNPSEIITSEKFAQQINQMHRKLQCLQLALVNRKGPILHDDARPHITQPTLQKLNELGYVVCLIPPYSPDLLLTDYHFFKHLNNFL